MDFLGATTHGSLSRKWRILKRYGQGKLRLKGLGIAEGL